MISQFLIGIVLIILTVIIHAVALDRLIHALDKVGPLMFKALHRSWKIGVLVFTVTSVFGVHILEIWLWALFYFGMDILPDLEAALYFSTTTATTVGYGDVYLNEDWRLLSSFQSANGFLLFGWSTAFIFEIMNKIYKEERIRKIRIKE